MRWGIFFLFMGFLASCSNPSSKSNTQVQVKDSIQTWANTAKNNTELLLSARFKLVNRAYKENATVKSEKSKVKNLSRISLAFLELGDTINFRKTNQELIVLGKKVGDKIAQGEAHWDMGSYLKNRQPDSSYYHFKEAYNLFKQVDFENEGVLRKASYPGRMLLGMASRKDDIKDYVGAEKLAISAIEEFKSVQAKDGLYNAYNTLAGTQSGLNKFEKALEYYSLAKEFIEYKAEERQERYYRTNLNNVASIYLRKTDYSKAYELYSQLEELTRKDKNNPLLIEYAYSSMAISGFKSGNLNLGEATKLIERSNKGLDSLGNEYQKARNYQYLAEIVIVDGDFEKAVAYAVRAKDIAKVTGNNDRQLEILKLLSQIDVENGQRHAKAYFDLSEELQQQERAIQDKFARIQLETDEVIEENASLAKRTELLAGVAIGLLVLGIGVFTIISQRISNDKLKFQQRQQQSNQEIYSLMLAQHGKVEEGKKTEQKRVSEELHDGILGQMLGIRLILSGLNERNDPSAIEQRAELIVKLQELEEEIRTISHELNASAYEKTHNFILSLQDLIKTVKKSSKISIEFEYDRLFEWDSLHSDIKINSYRVIQELLQNCVKHAKCKNIKVAFTKNKNSLNLVVKDDGIGFNNSSVKKGIGLKNIVSRVKKMTAQIDFNSSSGQGTEVSISIPNIDLKKQHPKPISVRKEVLGV